MLLSPSPCAFVVIIRARASRARAPGGITLGPEQGELDADFTALGGGDALLHKSGH